VSSRIRHATWCGDWRKSSTPCVAANVKRVQVDPLCCSLNRRLEKLPVLEIVDVRSHLAQAQNQPDLRSLEGMILDILRIDNALASSRWMR